MELIAALLHSPRLLLLDEPTIGLDVVAQVAIQKCLRDYHTNARRDDAPDQPLHARRRGAVLAGAGDHPRRRWSTTARSSGITERFGRVEAGQAPVRRGAVPPTSSAIGEVDRTARGRRPTSRSSATQVAEVLGAILDRTPSPT